MHRVTSMRYQNNDNENIKDEGRKTMVMVQVLIKVANFCGKGIEKRRGTAPQPDNGDVARGGQVRSTRSTDWLAGGVKQCGGFLLLDLRHCGSKRY